MSDNLKVEQIAQALGADRVVSVPSWDPGCFVGALPMLASCVRTPVFMLSFENGL